MLPIHKIDAGRQHGFDIRFEFYPEDMDPADSFDMTGPELREMYYKIETGQWEWFWVKCIASIDGIDLGTDTLGACLYDSFEQFVQDNDYSNDMIELAVDQAKQSVQEIVDKIA
jgi:hypothetical protein